MPAPSPPASAAKPAPAAGPVGRSDAASTAPAAGALRMVQAPIPFPDSRKQEMAAYSLRHYGTASWQLTPTMVVLHYTAGGTAASTRNVFSADTPNAGELPGTCAHFVVDKDGTVYQLVPTTVRCRHTIGLNDQAIGIEMVQEAGPSSSWADQQILGRPAQIGAALALVRQLQSTYAIATGNVVGHATANSTPQFHDLTGARNDHTDWLPADLAVFRSRL
ncbi:peptidoglycan recognition family protein [Lapillicoccus sp.]|uniref:N-acetylmuramoyl-L-alanine amidase n=1 Tax=Lapillicoccus sp. TaxID=1909287 RepID=UPI003263343B